MATSTTKIGLKKPGITDEIETTLKDLSDNFQKLDELSEEYAPSPPISGLYYAGKRLWNNFTISSGYVGWANIRTGTAAPVWEKLKLYAVGSVVVPARDNGHYYTVVQAGHSGFTEPIYPVSDNGQVNDIRGANTWISSHLYSLNDIVIPTIDNGRFYLCIQAGESSNLEPAWPQVDGATIIDKNANWRSYRIAKWKESGPASLFKPFGKIE
ncbi:hypothetical protein [Paenibacillus sp. FSL H3-0333]|uniref:hypothetical protein n=1 Tax=Paenibacillus sp. FSL H3-0333 TaxID=2921373 RepID=UPI0030FAFEFD